MKKLCIMMLFLVWSMVGYSKTYSIPKETVIRLVQETVIGMEKNYRKEWITLLAGTLAVETNLGQYKGASKMGITQITKVSYTHNRDLLLKDKDMTKKVVQTFKIHPRDITYSHIVKNHKLSVFFMYLHYKYQGIDIKKASTPKEAGRIWKKYYNTYKGKGTVS